MTERERKKDNLCSHETDHGLDSKRDKGNGTLFSFFFSQICYTSVVLLRLANSLENADGDADAQV